MDYTIVVCGMLSIDRERSKCGERFRPFFKQILAGVVALFDPHAGGQNARQEVRSFR